MGRTINGIAELRKAAGFTQPALAARASVSVEQLARIEKGKSEPSFSMAWRICQALNTSLHDLLNLTGFAEELGPFIRLPCYINEPALVEQVRRFNEPEMRSRYFQFDRFNDRFKLYLSFKEVIPTYEAKTPEYLKYRRSEYLPPDTEEGLYAPDYPGKLELGEAFEAVRKAMGYTTTLISRETGVAQSMLSKFENNQIDLGLQTYDKLTRFLGLRSEELVYVKEPPRWRWPLFLPWEESYLNREMVANNIQDNLDFWGLGTVEQRAEVMVAFRHWLKAEQEAREQKSAEAPPAPEAFERLKVWGLKLA